MTFMFIIEEHLTRLCGSAAPRRRPRPPLGPALLCLFGLATPAMRMAEAHPVAQGTMEVLASLDRVTVLVTVSNEEILVAAASGRGAASPREAARGHADYLLAHLHI